VRHFDKRHADLINYLRHDDLVTLSGVAANFFRTRYDNFSGFVAFMGEDWLILESPHGDSPVEFDYDAIEHLQLVHREDQ
jgi:hypothetical protein